MSMAPGKIRRRLCHHEDFWIGSIRGCPQVYGDGSQQYDFVDVSDVAHANILAIRADVSGKCYNVGRGIGT